MELNIKDVQAFLGHSDIRTTAVYLHSSEEQLRSVAELTALRAHRPSQESQKEAVIHAQADANHAANVCGVWLDRPDQ